MPSVTVRVVDVYPYRPVKGAVEFLLLRRAPEVIYAGQWRMVSGKIRTGEAAWQTALRELREETGQTPECLFALPSVNLFYEWQADRVNIAPAFAAALGADPALCREHDAFAWLAPEAAAARLVWPEQRRLLRLAHRLVADGVPPELRIALEKTEQR